VAKIKVPVYAVRTSDGERNLSFVRMLIDRRENVNAMNQDGQLPCGTWKTMRDADRQLFRCFGMPVQGEGSAHVNLKFAVPRREKS